MISHIWTIIIGFLAGTNYLFNLEVVPDLTKDSDQYRLTFAPPMDLISPLGTNMMAVFSTKEYFEKVLSVAKGQNFVTDSVSRQTYAEGE